MNNLYREHIRHIMTEDEDLPFDSKMLDRMASVCIKFGLNLQHGQDLIITSTVESLPLVRRITEEAYKAGAGVVTTILSDEELSLAKYRYGSEESFDRAPEWIFKGMAEAFSNNTARLAISGDNPMLLSGQNPEVVSRVGKAMSIASKPAMEKITNFETNWNIVSYPGSKWAKQVFPELSESDAVRKLAEVIFSASRIDGENPVEDLSIHHERLKKRQEWLNEYAFKSLHYTASGTDLIIGLADGHAWKGGASMAKNGIICSPNIPTEEVFTTPHAYQVDGIVKATKPLVYRGTLIDGIEVRFERGEIVEAKATEGEEVFLQLLDTDSGSRRLGEVALVPHSSPISQSGILFYNTLYDENAACHIALGQCYSKCFREEITSNPKAIKDSGGNSSMIHVDWMIGSDELDIDGITTDGIIVPVFRNGEWANEI